MAFQGSTGKLLREIESAVDAGLDDGWVAEPPAARAALLVREALRRWTQDRYPGSTLEGGAIVPDSRRHLVLTIHSAPVSHRVEVWGLACDDEREPHTPDSGHVPHSWVVLAHLGPPCERMAGCAARLERAGLRKLDQRESGRLALSLWMGAAAPDGCPACLGKE